MNEPTVYSKAADLVLATMAGLLLWFTKRSVTKFDERMEALERDAVRNKEMSDLRAQLASEHDDNTKTLERIQNSMTSVHTRVDDVYKFLVNRK